MNAYSALAFAVKADQQNKVNKKNRLNESYKTGETLFLNYNYSGSLQKLNEALQIDPNHFLSTRLRSFCSFMLGDIKSAFITVDAAIRMNQMDSSSHLYKSIFLFEIGNYADSFTCANTSLSINNSGLPAMHARIMRAMCHLKHGRVNEAKQDYEVVLTQSTEYVIFHAFPRISLLLLANKYQEAIEAVDRERSANYKISPIFNSRLSVLKAYAYYSMGQPDRAIEMAQIAVTIIPFSQPSKDILILSQQMLATFKEKGIQPQQMKKDVPKAALQVTKLYFVYNGQRKRRVLKSEIRSVNEVKSLCQDVFGMSNSIRLEINEESDNKNYFEFEDVDDLWDGASIQISDSLPGGRHDSFGSSDLGGSWSAQNQTGSNQALLSDSFQKFQISQGNVGVEAQLQEVITPSAPPIEVASNSVQNQSPQSPHSKSEQGSQQRMPQKTMLGPYEIVSDRIKSPSGGCQLAEMWHPMRKKHFMAKYPSSQAKFRRELGALQAANEDSAVHVIDVFESECCFVMEMGKSTLLEGIEMGMSVPVCDIVVKEIVQCIAGLHAGNVVHADIKPGNIMTFATAFFKDKFKFIDFDQSGRMGDLVDISYTPNYAPPEIAQLVLNGSGSMVLNKAMDIWSLGMTILHLYTGQSPFIGFDEAGTLSILASAFDPSEYLPMQQLPQLIRDLLVRKMLVPNPNKRASIQEIANHAFFVGGLTTVQRSDNKMIATSLKTITSKLDSIHDDVVTILKDLRSANTAVVFRFLEGKDEERPPDPKSKKWNSAKVFEIVDSDGTVVHCLRKNHTFFIRFSVFTEKEAGTWGLEGVDHVEISRLRLYDTKTLEVTELDPACFFEIYTCDIGKVRQMNALEFTTAWQTHWRKISEVISSKSMRIQVEFKLFFNVEGVSDPMAFPLSIEYKMYSENAKLLFKRFARKTAHTYDKIPGPVKVFILGASRTAAIGSGEKLGEYLSDNTGDAIASALRSGVGIAVGQCAKNAVKAALVL